MGALRRTLGVFSYYAQWIPMTTRTKLVPSLAPLNPRSFPLCREAEEAFIRLKTEIEKAAVYSIDENVPFMVETDATDAAVAATLNQGGRPVAFFSQTLNASEQLHSAVDKEAYAIVEALRKWRHFLTGRHFL